MSSKPKMPAGTWEEVGIILTSMKAWENWEENRAGTWDKLRSHGTRKHGRTQANVNDRRTWEKTEIIQQSEEAWENSSESK